MIVQQCFMPKRSSTDEPIYTTVKILPPDKKDPHAVSRVVAVPVWRELSPQDISRVMSEMGRKGGLKGGHARAEKLSKRKRREIAKKAAAARWKMK